MNFFLKRYSIYIFTVFLLSACGSDVDDKQSVSSAKQYIEKNQLQDAYHELKNALQINPENAEARYLLGQVNLTIGDSEFAAKEFRKARQAGWDEGESNIGLMRAWKMGRQFQKMLDDVEIKDSYGDAIRADMYGLKAYAEAVMGYAGLAKVSINTGREIDSDAIQVMMTSIQIELASGRLDAASEQIKKALTLDANNTELLLLSAAVAIKNEAFEPAVASYRKVLSFEPKNIVTYTGRNARVGLARLEIQNKNLQQAKDLLKPIYKQNSDDPEVNFLRGLLAFEEQDLDQAEELFLKVLRLIPSHARTLLLFGAVNFAQKDYEQASYYTGRYLQLVPDDIKARKLLGRTYILMGQHEEAQSVLRTGLQEGTDAELLALIGMSQLQSGDTESGISGLKKAIQAAPKNSALRGELAKAYITAGQTDSAIKQLNAILAEGGNENQAATLKVKAYLRAKQYDQAINTVLDILEQSSKDVTVITLVGNVFAISGDGAEARKYFNQALKIAPDNMQAAMLLAALEEVEGKADVAKAVYEKLSSNNPKTADPMLALARLAAEEKDYVAMISWLEKASEQAPMEIRSRYVLAEYYLRDNQLDKAGAIVEEALGVSSKEPSLLLLKSRILLVQHRYNEALPSLKELVTRSPKSVYARSLLGETYMMLEQYGNARQQLNLVLKEQPYYVGALVALSRVEQLSNNYERAIEYIERVKKIDPKYYPAYEAGGDILMAAKNYKAATESYKQAVLLKPSAEVVIKHSESLIRQAKAGEAAEVLRDWLIKMPDDTRVIQFLGNAYLADGENAKAIQAFETVYKQQPENIIALNNLAWLYSLKNDSRAIIFAEKAYKLKADDAAIQDTYGWILVQQGQVEKGRRLLEQVITELPDVAEVRYHYAVALYESGEKIEAKKLLNRLLQSGQSFDGRENAQRLVSQ